MYQKYYQDYYQQYYQDYYYSEQVNNEKETNVETGEIKQEDKKAQEPNNKKKTIWEYIGNRSDDPKLPNGENFRKKGTTQTVMLQRESFSEILSIDGTDMYMLKTKMDDKFLLLFEVPDNFKNRIKEWNA